MTSSFRKSSKIKVGSEEISEDRKKSSEFRVFGLKPWTSGSLGVISTGQRELDNILGGGHVLGTFMLLFSDSYTDYTETMIKYSISEGIAMNHQRVIVIDTNSHFHSKTTPPILSSLPYNINYGKNNPTTDYSSASSFNESERSHSSKVTESELKIAWQYGKYITQEEFKSKSKSTSSSSKSSEFESTYCCSYDLSKRIQSSLLEKNLAQVINFEDTKMSLTDLFNQIESKTKDFHENEVIRMIIPDMEHLFYSLDSDIHNRRFHSRDVLQFTLQLKHFIRDRPIILVASIHPNSIKSIEFPIQLSYLADTVISIESFAGRLQAIPYEFKDFIGFLSIKKIQQLGSLASYRPPYDRYGLKRNRRKLCIEPLHLPPEESRAFGSAGTDEQLKAKAKDQSHVQSHVQPLGQTQGQRIELQIEKDHSHPSIGFEDKSESEIQSMSTKSSLLTSTEVIRKKSLADSFAAARATRQALKASALSGSSTSSSAESVSVAIAVSSLSSDSSNTTSDNQPPLAPGSSCSRINLEF